MKIAIEAQRIFRKEKHGMDYVALETIRELQKIDQQNEYFILVSPGDDVCLQESANMHIVTVNWPSYPLWEQIGLPLALKKIKPDLLHCTSNTAPVYGNIPLVLTLHDIIFLEKKQGKNQSMYQRLGRFYRKIIVPQILTKCKRIITVSHFECNRISHFLHIDKQLLVAVYNGYSQHFIPIWNAQAITARYIKNHPYLFFLGNTDPKKNTARVLQAYRIYLKKIQSAPSLAYRRPERRDHRRISEPGRITRNKKKCCIIPDTFQTQNYPLFIVEHPSLYTRLYAKVSASPF